MRAIRIKNSWIFGPGLDLFCFLSPFLISFYVAGSKYEAVKNSWMTFFLAKIFLGGGHIFATYVPFFTGKELHKRIGNKLPWFPILFASAYAIANLIDQIWFQNFLALTGLLHIYLQHSGFLKVLNKTDTLKRKKIERNALLIILGLPNLIWLLNQLENRPSYLYPITITAALPKLSLFQGGTLTSLSIVLALLVLVISLNTKPKEIIIDLGKLLYFGSTVFWMCYGLFFVKALGFFHTYLALSHGVTYILYISLGWPSHKFNGTWLGENRLLKVSVLAIVTGFLWFLLFKPFKGAHPALTFVPWLPLILHYSFDSLIWRRFEGPKVTS